MYIGVPSPMFPKEMTEVQRALALSLISFPSAAPAHELGIVKHGAETDRSTSYCVVQNTTEYHITPYKCLLLVKYLSYRIVCSTL